MKFVGVYAGVVRSLIGTAGMRVEGNDVDLATNTTQKLAKRYRIVHRIVDPAEQDILKGNPLSPRNRQRAAAIHQLLQRVFAVDWHQPTT